MVLAAVFAVAWLIQIILHLVVWQGALRQAGRQAKTPLFSQGEQPGVSVLVYSHNQAEALARNLPVLLNQNYPKYEVIVLDDNSRDNTQDVLTMMDQRSDILMHTKIDEKTRAMSHRKLAVLLGTKSAHYDLILMTHAECMPASADWIGGLVSHFANPGIEVVLGPVVYERRTGFLSRFCQFDLFQRLLLMLGIALSVKAYAGWGQNLAFRKSTFYANRSQGFQRHLKMQPGEDDLFVADVARYGNVAVDCTPQTVMTDQSKPLFINWSIDRLNRGYTSRLYPWIPVVVKHLDYLTRYLTVISGLILIVYALMHIFNGGGSRQYAWITVGAVLAMLLIRIALIVFTHVRSAKALKQHPMVAWPILCDLYTPFVDLWFRCKALIYRKRFGVGKVGLY
ncbi:MAG: glycosyltransferase [Bacteroidales bacterium]|nr:glycosyltransferase [Bacteroidales bacterium]